MPRRRLRPVLALLGAAAFASGCGADAPAGSGDAASGRAVYAASGCGSCHTFAAAGSRGRTGPALDAPRPSRDLVVRRVTNGSGAMPRFGGRLSAQEIRDVAAFVGTAAADDDASAGYLPDDVRIDDCDGGSATCVEQAFANLAFREGPRAALARLQSETTRDPTVAASCHRIAHRMGAAALLRFRGRVAAAFVEGSAVCASGYYHGIVERSFQKDPEGDLADVAGRLCSDTRILRTRFLAFQCIHGLGHGLMIHTGYDLPRSLATCDALPDDYRRESCAGGAFMENFATSRGATSRYVRSGDPIYPCNDVLARRHRRACYQLVTANLLRTTGHDLGATAAGCRRSEAAWIATCFQSFGRDVSGIAGRDPRAVERTCRLAGADAVDCIVGAAQEMTNSDAGGARAARFCGLVPRETTPRCFAGVGGVLAAVLPNRRELVRTCRRLADTHEADCRRGAGLEALRP